MPTRVLRKDQRGRLTEVNEREGTAQGQRPFRHPNREGEKLGGAQRTAAEAKAGTF